MDALAYRAAPRGVGPLLASGEILFRVYEKWTAATGIHRRKRLFLA